MTVPVYNMTDTWNDGGTVFSSIKMNVTNTASAAGSSLLDLQIGGTSKCEVDKDGTLFAVNLASIDKANNPAILFTDQSIGFGPAGIGGSSYYAFIPSGVIIGYNLPLTFGSGGPASLGDVQLIRDAAGILAQRNATSGQSFRVYNTYTDASNYERAIVDFKTESNVAHFGTEALGTGTLRYAQFGTFGSGGSLRTGMVIPGMTDRVDFYTNTVHLTTIANNAIGSRANTTIGWTASTDPTAALDTAISRSAAGVVAVGNGTAGNASGTVRCANLDFGGLGSYIYGNNASNTVQLGVNSNDIAAVVWATTPYLNVRSTAAFGWSSTADPVATPDLVLLRDAAGILAQRNGTSAQVFRLYNTYTDSSNYERGVFDWTTTANVLTIGAQAAGTGTQRAIRLTLPQITTPTLLFGSSALQVGFFTSGMWLGDYSNSNFSTGAKLFGFSVDSTGARLDVDYLRFDATAGNPAITRSAAGVLAFGDGSSIGNATAYYQWGGQKRVASDVPFTSTTTLGTVTGLSVNVAAGRTYSFWAKLAFTDAAAGGIRAAIAGTATATNILYDGYIIDSAANGLKGNAQATALGTVVANAATTGTAGVVHIEGTITVNAAGTLLVQAAQSVSNGTATTIKRGSYFIVHDMP